MVLDPDLRRGRCRPAAGAMAAAMPIAMPILAGCDRPQSAFGAGADHGAAVLELSLVLFVGGGVIFVAVMALALYAVLASPERFPGSRAWVIGGGIAFPVLVLTALQIYEFSIARTLAAAPPGALRIEVTGRMWWWEVRYPDGPDGQGGVVRTANQIHIPVGRPVEFVVTAGDVIHSFWVPGLAGKIDMIPGHTNRLTLIAGRPGVYRGQCAEYCGAQHALMAFHVVAEPPERFAAWLAAQSRPAAEPATPELAAGRDAFLRFGCGSCHRVGGTAAAGMLGPDLTHVGSRLTLAAGTLPNATDTLSAWIADAQHVKPENGMPSFAIIDPDALRAMAAWLESLE